MGQLESKSISDNSDHNNFQNLQQRQQRRGSNDHGHQPHTTTSSTTTTAGFGGNLLFSSRSDDIFDELEDDDSKSSQSFQNTTQFLSLLGHNILGEVKKANEHPTTVQSIPIYGNNRKDNSLDLSKAPKLVLVGTGSSGKTSLSKLLKIHSSDYSITNFDIKNWRKILLKNIFQAIRVIFDVKESLFPNIPYLNVASYEFKNRFSHIPAESIDNILGDASFLNDDMCEKLVDFWLDEPIVQICYFFASIAYQFIDGYGDFSKNRIEKPVYIRHLNLENVSTLISQLEDVLNYETDGDDFQSKFSSAIKDDSHIVTELIVSTYVKTTGIIEIPVKFGDNNLVGLYDTGGQRNERKKWKNIMNDNSQTLSGVLFLVPLAEYNQICYEDDSINRTIESLNLFSELVNRNTFGSIPFFLIFTKKKVMEDKLKLYDLSHVPFQTELAPELRVEFKLNEENKKDLLVNILKMKQHDIDKLTLREIKLIDRFSSDPRYTPSQLLKIINGDKTIQSATMNHSEFVNKNIEFFKQQFFNAIQDPERKTQVIRDHQVIDVKDFDHTIQVMHSIFRNISQ